MTEELVGIWLVGARGGVATTTLLGLSALKMGLIAETGLVTGLPQFADLPFPAWDNLVVGGHEIRRARLADEARALVERSRALPGGLVEQCRDALEEIDRRIRPGTVLNVGPTIDRLATETMPRDELPAAAVGRLQEDMQGFAAAHGLAHVVVVNVASTEPPADPAAFPSSWKQWDKLLKGDDSQIPASTLYAIAALELGYSYINFTPSLGSRPEAIDQLARERQTRHMGCDGKTGETLMKSVLAPMFQQRNLRVMSWVGHNIFGNMDGQVLNDPVNKQAKVASKDHLLAEILGYRPQTHVSIEYIESLGDWKTAWDHIHFEGFLGMPMTLQFIWQGCDSLLAAPLVLDLVRWTDLARRRGETGRMTFLSSFFKSPYEVSQQAFDRQYQELEAWATGRDRPDCRAEQ